MTAGYSTLTKEQSKQEIVRMRAAAKRIASKPGGSRAFLIRIGILSADGKKLSRQYR